MMSNNVIIIIYEVFSYYASFAFGTSQLYRRSPSRITIIPRLNKCLVVDVCPHVAHNQNWCNNNLATITLDSTENLRRLKSNNSRARNLWCTQHTYGARCSIWRTVATFYTKQRYISVFIQQDSIILTCNIDWWCVQSKQSVVKSCPDKPHIHPQSTSEKNFLARPLISTYHETPLCNDISSTGRSFYFSEVDVCKMSRWL
jgi:hypothetical protein